MSYSFIQLVASKTSSPETQDFTTNFAQAIDLRDGDYSIALQSVYHYYSFYNISAALGNNLINYNNGSVDRVLTIPDGTYSIELLNDWLHGVMLSFGDVTTTSGVNTFDITIRANFAELKVDIDISGGYTLDLTQSDINLLLGFNSVVVNSSTTGSNPANINNGVNSLNVECDIINGGFSGGFSSNVIHNYTPNNLPGSLISSIPFQLVWLPVSQRNVQSINIRITDQLGRLLDLNGEDVTVNLILKRNI